MVRKFKNYIVKEENSSYKNFLHQRMEKDPNFKKLSKIFDKYGYELLVAINRTYGTVIDVRAKNLDMPEIHYSDNSYGRENINGFTVHSWGYTISNKKDLDNYAKWAKDVNDLMSELSKWDFNKMLPFEDD